MVVVINVEDERCADVVDDGTGEVLFSAVATCARLTEGEVRLIQRGSDRIELVERVSIIDYAIRWALERAHLVKVITVYGPLVVETEGELS